MAQTFNLKTIYILLITFFFSFSAVAEKKEKIDEFKEPKSIQALNKRAESMFLKGDWIGTLKYTNKYLNKFKAPSKEEKKDYFKHVCFTSKTKPDCKKRFSTNAKSFLCQHTDYFLLPTRLILLQIDLFAAQLQVITEYVVAVVIAVWLCYFTIC